MYAVQDVAGCRADRKQPSATATLISGGGSGGGFGGTKVRAESGGAARPLDERVSSGVGCEMEISRSGGGTCGAGGASTVLLPTGQLTGTADGQGSKHACISPALKATFLKRTSSLDPVLHQTM